jgi:hypothetical protein
MQAISPHPVLPASVSMATTIVSSPVELPWLIVYTPSRSG